MLETVWNAIWQPTLMENRSMNKFVLLGVMGLSALLAGCSGKQEASKDNFAKAIDDYIGQQRVCQPVVLGLDNAGVGAAKTMWLGAKEIRIPMKNTDGDKINKLALKQMSVLADADLYEEGKKTEVAAGKESIPVAVYYRTAQGDQQIAPSTGGTLLCLGTQKVDKVVLFTEPTPANGVTVSKVIFDAKLVPEKWAGKLLELGDKDKSSISSLPETQRERATMVLTNKGWRDMRELR